MSTDPRDEMLARLMAGESVPDADEAVRQEATQLQAAIRQSFDAEVSETTHAEEKARAFEIAQKRWSKTHDTYSATNPDKALGYVGSGHSRDAGKDTLSWWTRVLRSLESLMPRPQAWAFATIAAAVIGITLSLQYQGGTEDDPFRVRGGDIQTVTLTVVNPAAKAEEIRRTLVMHGLEARVRQDGVFYFVDVTRIPLPSDDGVGQAFAGLGLPSPSSGRMEVGLRPEE